MSPKHVEEHNYRNKILCIKLESEVNNKKRIRTAAAAAAAAAADDDDDDDDDDMHA